MHIILQKSMKLAYNNLNTVIIIFQFFVMSPKYLFTFYIWVLFIDLWGSKHISESQIRTDDCPIVLSSIFDCVTNSS